MLVAELDMTMNEVANGLDPLPAGRRSAEERPCGIRKPVGLAISAAEKKDQRAFGQSADLSGEPSVGLVADHAQEHGLAFLDTQPR